MNIFYVYEHWRPDTNTCFYVGKGKGNRAYDVKRYGNPHYKHIALKLLNLNLSVAVKIIKKDLLEEDAFDFEKRRISYWRRKKIKLTNATDGGEGGSGVRWSNIRKQKASKKLGPKLRAYRKTKVWKEAFKIAMLKTRGTKRKPHSNKTIKKMSLAAKQRKPTSKLTREKMRQARLGWKWSTEVKAKMRASALRV